ncbi:MAG: hypothetical protein ACK4V4_08250 [Sphingobacteriales bacterium]|jgi:hypothetical protein
MFKYLITRLLFVFLCKFFLSWSLNTESHLDQFFDYKNGSVLCYLFSILIIALGLFTINLLFTIIHFNENEPFEDRVKILKIIGLVHYSKTFFINFWSILKKNFKVEIETEKYPGLFIVFIFFFLPFFKGNPILNNYYGIYKEYEITEENQGGYIENPNYIIHKNNTNEIRGRINNLEENSGENEPYFDVKKRGYLFVQAGIIDGYKTYYKEYKGFLSYFECLFLSGIEKLINTIMYFFIPFVVFILIYHYKFEVRKSIYR